MTIRNGGTGPVPDGRADRGAPDGQPAASGPAGQVVGISSPWRFLPQRTPGKRFAAVLALVLSGLVLGAGPALAHDQLDETNPADGSTVQTVPDEIVLDFSATPLALGSAVRVVGPGGDITSGKPKVVDNRVTQEVSAGRPAGDYTVQWRVTSSDGHPISGEFGFTARKGDEVSTASPEPSSAATGTEAAAPGTTVATAATETEDGGTSPVLIITLLVLALVVIGAVAYLFVLAPKRSREN
ncbi:copper resistance CopC family protein [Kineosporia sp. NBRC 101731]|uniref:copper resistance CopC family protein n=1 Tax=Kineosporia sp. NBRC 101731 TaxID=3032199 RepID=UPI0024A36DD9|nr:copper resistance CopC family protein [Kineosporia sp. NBRC 101731]GLY30060.1 hypothetical protein Kisp02_34250 [Kineosporia sp. NBRC 101731]